MRIKLFSFVFAALCVITLCACTNDESLLVGKWRQSCLVGSPSYESMTFKSDGTYIESTLEGIKHQGKWSLSKSTITITEKDGRQSTLIIEELKENKLVLVPPKLDIKIPMEKVGDEDSSVSIKGFLLPLIMVFIIVVITAIIIFFLSKNKSSNQVEDKKKGFKKYLIFVLGLIALIAICGGTLYGKQEYAAYQKRKTAHEKFVADSLERAREDAERAREDAYREFVVDSLERAGQKLERVEALQKPFLDLLDEYEAKWDDENLTEYYFLYDLDGDKMPELWLYVCDDGFNYNLLVYSNKDGEANLLFKGGVGRPSRVAFLKGVKYVLCEFATQGHQSVDQYYMDNGVVKQKNIFDLFTYDEYEDFSEPKVSTYELSDKSPFNFEIQ